MPAENSIENQAGSEKRGCSPGLPMRMAPYRENISHSTIPSNVTTVSM